ncbi:MAG TPA: chemotaxis response regulator protein-glutamate methylesterase [Acidobacteriaceae bacterium]|nr:chemotaxis response regulator protein-glutamate methylesterase [Acidobacteriaceae bacterium]
MSSPVQPRPWRRIRVLAVDDSAVVRGILRMVFDRSPEIEVAATASNGEEGLADFDRVHPDVVLLDIEMPGMNGLEALSAIRRRDRRVPVIMCSTLTSRGAQITLDALLRGATDYVTKPAAQSGVRQAVETLGGDLIPKILALFAEPPPIAAEPRSAPALPPATSAVPRLVAVGVSTGGPAALEKLLPALPSSFPLPVLVVQHMPQLFTRLLAERLNSLCALSVREAADGERAEAGTVVIARGDWHMELTRDFRLCLNQDAPENFCRPSVDALFRSAAQMAAGRVLGVVLTGMGSDGLAGSRAIRTAGGTVLAQDAASSVIWGMPGAVAGAGLASRILPLDAMAGEILRCARVPVPGARPAEAVAV